VRRADKLPPSCASCLEIWEPQPPGTLRACPGLYIDCFTFLQGLQTITCVALNARRPRPTQDYGADDYYYYYDYDGVLNLKGFSVIIMKEKLPIVNYILIQIYYSSQ